MILAECAATLPIVVLADANFLAIPAQFGVDIFSQTEEILERKVSFVTLSSVVDEIRRKIAQGGRVEAVHFRVANELLQKCTIVPVPADLAGFCVDDQLIEYAWRSRAVLATNDRCLLYTSPSPRD